MSDRPTPRTDSAFALWQEQGSPHDDEADPWLLASELERELAEAQEEGEEQARLLGMSGEREAGLLAEVDRLKRELAETVACMRLAEAATIRALHERNEARAQKWQLADACRWAQVELGKHTRPSPIDKALAELKVK